MDDDDEIEWDDDEYERMCFVLRVDLETGHSNHSDLDLLFSKGWDMDYISTGKTYGQMMTIFMVLERINLDTRYRT